jgi:hypothetical protein
METAAVSPISLLGWPASTWLFSSMRAWLAVRRASDERHSSFPLILCRFRGGSFETSVRARADADGVRSALVASLPLALGSAVASRPGLVVLLLQVAFASWLSMIVFGVG